VYYIAHRLFAAHDRALAAMLADRLAQKAGAGNVFLPFCDTNEEDLVAEEKGRRLYELDRARLNHLDGMIALLHGPSLDDGVCMELGYAAALGVPTIILTTDFQTYSLAPDGPQLAFADPLVETVATSVIRAAHLGPETPTPTPAQRFAAFAARNRTQIDHACTQAIAALLDHTPHPRPQAPRSTQTTYVEPARYDTEPDRLVNTVRLHIPGEVIAARRFTAPDPLGAAEQDWQAALHADTVIADVSGPEAPPGAALLIGATAALGHTAISYTPRPEYTHAPGREPNWRNLMIQYASRRLLTDPAALAEERALWTR